MCPLITLVSRLFKQQIHTLSLSEKTSLIKQALQIIMQFFKNKRLDVTAREIDFVKSKILRLVDLFIDYQEYSLTVSGKNAQKKISLQFMEKLLNNDITSKSKGGAEIIKNETVKIFKNLFSKLINAKLSTKEKFREADSDIESNEIDESNTNKVKVDQNIGDLLDFHLQSIDEGERESNKKQVNAFISSLFKLRKLFYNIPIIKLKV